MRRIPASRWNSQRCSQGRIEESEKLAVTGSRTQACGANALPLTEHWLHKTSCPGFNSRRLPAFCTFAVVHSKSQVFCEALASGPLLLHAHIVKKAE